MRLNNYPLLLQISSLGLSGPTFSDTKLLLCLGEKLKDNEQCILFLKKCRSLRIFPVFIRNNFQFSENIFPIGPSSSCKQLLFKLRLQALNQNITFKYELVREIKTDIHLLRTKLQSATTPTMYSTLIEKFNCNNEITKIAAKQRLSQKLNWLIYKYYTAEWSNWRPYSPNRWYEITRNDQDPNFRSPNLEPVDTVEPQVTTTTTTTTQHKVTHINIEETSIPEECKELLSLGPGYAVTPNFRGKNKEHIIQEICDKIAETAIRLRWNTHFKERPSAPTLDQHLKMISPFDKKYTKPPPTENLDLENRLVQFQDTVRKILNNTSVSANLTRPQKDALRKMKSNDNLHISVADKTAEFVVMKKSDHINVTKLHFENTAYKKLEMPQSEKTAIKFIAKLTESLENKVNSKWREICRRRNLSEKIYDLFASHHTTLPTGRVQIKTHKHSSEEISSIPTELLKVRPIVSNCNSPMDKLTFLLCHLLNPLLDAVPSHLKNTHDVLTKLQRLSPEQLKGQTFFTADVEALYTNINVETAIDDIIELAGEHRNLLKLYGLTLTDIHELLEVSLLNSYFVYDNQVYNQLYGFFMGVRPAPLGAIIKMWKLEKNSIYVDSRISPIFYGRYYDDLAAVTSNIRKARLICTSIETEDPDNRIKLTVDYPNTRNDYTPFLNMEVKIGKDGSLDTRLYRKPQKKLLTLHYSSHHPLSVKEHTITNMYDTADNVSSNSTNKQHSERMIDELLLNNGYTSRVLDRIKDKRRNRRPNPSKNREVLDPVTTLKVPFLSDRCTAKIKEAAKSLQIPVRVVTTPGKKLRDILTSSRPLDKKKCPNNNCRTCLALNNNGNCTDRNVVYEVKCSYVECQQSGIGIYNGETYRPIGDRYTEHFRSANNPTAKSYKDMPLAKHYAEHHQEGNPKLELTVLQRASTTVDRKIKEARLILKNKPDLNNRDEQIELRKYLV